jgi:hypothetical protein
LATPNPHGPGKHGEKQRSLFRQRSIRTVKYSTPYI